MQFLTYTHTRAEMEQIYRSGWLRGMTCTVDGMTMGELHGQLSADTAAYFKPLDEVPPSSATMAAAPATCKFCRERQKSKTRKTGPLPLLSELHMKRWYQFWR